MFFLFKAMILSGMVFALALPVDSFAQQGVNATAPQAKPLLPDVFPPASPAAPVAPVAPVTPPENPASSSGAVPGVTAVAPVAPVAPKKDPCAAYLSSYEVYTICQDRMHKIQNMINAQKERDAAPREAVPVAPPVKAPAAANAGNATPVVVAPKTQ